MLHIYCKKDSDGDVCPRAWTYDGGPESVYPRVSITDLGESAQRTTIGEEEHYSGQSVASSGNQQHDWSSLYD